MKLILMLIIIGIILVIATGAASVVALSSSQGPSSLQISRVNSWSEGDYVSISNSEITKYPILQNAFDIVDQKYQKNLEFCSHAPNNYCKYTQSNFSVRDSSYHTIINSTEANGITTDLGLQALPVPQEAISLLLLHHGIHIKYNEKYYGITMVGIPQSSVTLILNGTSNSTQ